MAYVSEWLSLRAAVKHVAGVEGCSDDAADNLTTALRDGVVASRRAVFIPAQKSGDDITDAIADLLGDGKPDWAELSPEWWIDATILASGGVDKPGVAFVERLRLSSGKIAIEVRRADLEAYWPPKTTPPAPPPTDSPESVVTYNTGLPGRPTSWHLIKAEFHRRWAAADESEKRSKFLAAWSRDLIAWLEEKHPHAPVPKPDSVANNLGPVWRAAKKSAGYSTP